MSEPDDDDHDDLGIDLDAWAAPPPPAGIADAVIARMQGTNVNVAVAPVEPERAARRWWVLGGGLAAATAVAGTLLVVALAGGAPADGHGDVVADHAQRLVLGPSAAELDPGARVTWRRDGRRVTATQGSGAATWRVDSDDTLTIDTALGSIEASNASLRVEVQMKHDDEQRQRTKQTIATSAATAAAVALVTVIVYDGAVKVTHDGKATPVAAGVAYQIRAGGPNVIEEEITVAGAPSESERIKALEAEIAELERQIEAAKQPATAQLCDEVSCVLDNYTGPCCAQFKQRPGRRVDVFSQPRPRPGDPRPQHLDRTLISQGVARIKADVIACGGDYDGKIKMRVKVAPDGGVTMASADPPDASPADCIVDAFRSARFAQTQNGGSFSYPFVFGTGTARCDADRHLAEGQDAFSRGQNTEALASFDRAYRCKPEARTMQLAFASACKARDRSQAQRFWRLMTSAQRQSVLSMCVVNGITLAELDDGTGKLQILSKPYARVLLDGVEHGTTPLSLDGVPAGRHKITLVVGDDKYTWVVDVKAGETTRFSKDLQ